MGPMSGAGLPQRYRYLRSVGDLEHPVRQVDNLRLSTLEQGDYYLVGTASRHFDLSSPCPPELSLWGLPGVVFVSGLGKTELMAT